MMRATLLVSLLALSGCAAWKTHAHRFICVGACVHEESNVQKESEPGIDGLAPKKDDQD